MDNSSAFSVRIFGALLMALLVMPTLARAQVSTSQVPVQVEIESFGEDTFALGSLTSADGALPLTLWSGARAVDVSYLLEALPSRLDHPAQTEAYKRILLSPGSSPIGATNALTGEKLMLLARIGFYEEASSMAGLAGNLQNEPELAKAIAYAAMLDGDMTDACQRGTTLLRGRDDPFWLKLRLLCYGATGEIEAADLTFGLLVNSTKLSETDFTLFNAIATAQTPRNSIAPVDGFHYAAIRQLQLPITKEMLGKAEGGVLKAIALEPAAPRDVRAAATMRMAAHGTLDTRDVAAIFSSFEFETQRLADAGAIQQQFPDNLLVDALVYQASKLAMSGSGLDNQALIGEALRNASDPYRLRVLADLYYEDIKGFDVIQNYAPYAGEFALVGILEKDKALTQRWIGGLLFDQTSIDANESALTLLGLTALWDRAAADSISAAYGLPTVSTLSPQASFPALKNTTASITRLVEISLQAARSNSEGVSGLIALASLGLEATGELASVRDIISDRAFIDSGLSALVGELAFNNALFETHATVASRARSLTPPITTGSAAPASEIEATPAVADPSMVVPRLKPDRRG